MVWDVIGNQWFWLGAAGFFMVVLGGLLVIARRPVRKAKQSQEGGWSPTGRIDFSGPSDTDPDSIGSYVLQAEDTRMVRSIGGIDHHEIRWRRATLNEAKRVVSTYHARLDSAPSPAASADILEVETHVEAPSLSPLA